jgi:hypothetical protein
VSNRCVEKLVADNNLRTQMGVHAREKVLDRTIENVLYDTIAWYSRSIAKNKASGVFSKIRKLLILLCFVPFSMMILVTYETVLRFIT